MSDGAASTVIATRTSAAGDLDAVPTDRAVWSWPLPELGTFDRTLLRAACLVARRSILAVHGLEHVAPHRDPFILALNHSSRQEALLVPALLMLLRQGRRIHFLADWNFRMIPGVGLLYRRSGTITVTRKAARPRILNVLKPLFMDAVPAFEQARRHLVDGRSIGIFPEGTVNRDPCRLLRGRLGAARLSLEAGVPVVPAGIRFPAVPSGRPVPDGSAMVIEFGTPLRPPAADVPVAMADVRRWHGRIMTAISIHCEKSWDLKRQETFDEAH
jgi:1-acyl-sn-glycerol-3-phosphate acyltransferase